MQKKNAPSSKATATTAKSTTTETTASYPPNSSSPPVTASPPTSSSGRSTSRHKATDASKKWISQLNELADKIHSACTKAKKKFPDHWFWWKQFQQNLSFDLYMGNAVLQWEKKPKSTPHYARYLDDLRRPIEVNSFPSFVSPSKLNPHLQQWYANTKCTVDDEEEFKTSEKEGNLIKPSILHYYMWMHYKTVDTDSAHLLFQNEKRDWKSFNRASVSDPQQVMLEEFALMTIIPQRNRSQDEEQMCFRQVVQAIFQDWEKYEQQQSIGISSSKSKGKKQEPETVESAVKPSGKDKPKRKRATKETKTSSSHTQKKSNSGSSKRNQKTKQPEIQEEDDDEEDEEPLEDEDDRSLNEIGKRRPQSIQKSANDQKRVKADRVGLADSPAPRSGGSRRHHQHKKRKSVQEEQESDSASSSESSSSESSKDEESEKEEPYQSKVQSFRSSDHHENMRKNSLNQRPSYRDTPAAPAAMQYLCNPPGLNLTLNVPLECLLALPEVRNQVSAVTVGLLTRGFYGNTANELPACIPTQRLSILPAELPSGMDARQMALGNRINPNNSVLGPNLSGNPLAPFIPPVGYPGNNNQNLQTPGSNSNAVDHRLNVVAANTRIINTTSGSASTSVVPTPEQMAQRASQTMSAPLNTNANVAEALNNMTNQLQSLPKPLSATLTEETEDSRGRPSVQGSSTLNDNHNKQVQVSSSNVPITQEKKKTEQATREVGALSNAASVNTSAPQLVQPTPSVVPTPAGITTTSVQPTLSVVPITSVAQASSVHAVETRQQEVPEFVAVPRSQQTLVTAQSSALHSETGTSSEKPTLPVTLTVPGTAISTPVMPTPPITLDVGTDSQPNKDSQTKVPNRQTVETNSITGSHPTMDRNDDQKQTNNARSSAATVTNMLPQSNVGTSVDKQTLVGTTGPKSQSESVYSRPKSPVPPVVSAPHQETRVDSQSLSATENTRNNKAPSKAIYYGTKSPTASNNDSNRNLSDNNPRGTVHTTTPSKSDHVGKKVHVETNERSHGGELQQQSRNNTTLHSSTTKSVHGDHRIASEKSMHKTNDKVGSTDKVGVTDRVASNHPDRASRVNELPAEQPMNKGKDSDSYQQHTDEEEYEQRSPLLQASGGDYSEEDLPVSQKGLSRTDNR